MRSPSLVARASLREPDLPVARLDGPERELRLLVDHRDDLVTERTRAQSRLRWHLRSSAAFARHNGTAPVPIWSANSGRHRLSRTGNRQLNLALHRIAVTQIRLEGKGRDYLAKRMAAGDSKTEAIRALRRRISDEVYRRMRDDETVGEASEAPLAMAA